MVGGQAVIEGVMMRGPGYVATAVRDPAGKIVVKMKPSEEVRLDTVELDTLQGSP